MRKRVNLDLEPSFEDIQSHALAMFGWDYFFTSLNWTEPGSHAKRVDMEHAAEKSLRSRLLSAANRQAELA